MLPNLADRATVHRLARQYGVRPSKRHSQNFLLEAQIPPMMASAAALHKGQRVLEVGAGFGVLTTALLATGADVVAFEIDERLAAALQEVFRGRKNFSLVVGDFFRWYRTHAHELGTSTFAIVANLPYHASAHFFATVLSGPVQPSTIVVMLQKEVAERIAAKPGAMTLLSVSVQYFGEPRVLRTVAKSSFWPEPDVDSAVLAVERIHPAGSEADDLFRLARMAFANRRKQLHNSLAAGLHSTSAHVRRQITAAGIDPNARPQELSLSAWHALAKTFRGHTK